MLPSTVSKLRAEFMASNADVSGINFILVVFVSRNTAAQIFKYFKSKTNVYSKMKIT